MTEYELDRVLLEIKKRYNSKISELESAIEPGSKERLHVSRHRGSYQYYIVTEGNKPKYVKKSDDRLCSLAQQKYDSEILDLLKNKVKAIDEFIEIINPTDLEDAYCALGAGRQQLITPAFSDSKMFADRWSAEEYEKKPIYDDPSVQTTQNGEKVRSKSEVYIANELLHFGIPYKYEKPLKIGPVTYHPDFTVINPRTHRQYYWEHLGMTDDSGYCDDAIKRLRVFAAAGLLVGRDVIVTAESQHVPLNTRVIDSVINEYLV